MVTARPALPICAAAEPAGFFETPALSGHFSWLHREDFPVDSASESSSRISIVNHSQKRKPKQFELSRPGSGRISDGTLSDIDDRVNVFKGKMKENKETYFERQLSPTSTSFLHAWLIGDFKFFFWRTPRTVLLTPVLSKTSSCHRKAAMKDTKEKPRESSRSLHFSLWHISREMPHAPDISHKVQNGTGVGTKASTGSGAPLTSEICSVLEPPSR